MKERLSGMLVIRAFNTEKTEQQRFDEANRDLTNLNLFVNKAMSLMMPSLMFVMNAVSSCEFLLNHFQELFSSVRERNQKEGVQPPK